MQVERGCLFPNLLANDLLPIRAVIERKDMMHPVTMPAGADPTKLVSGLGISEEQGKLVMGPFRFKVVITSGSGGSDKSFHVLVTTA